MWTQATTDKKREMRRSAAASACGIEFHTSDLPFSTSDVRRWVTSHIMIPA